MADIDHYNKILTDAHDFWNLDKDLVRELSHVRGIGKWDNKEWRRQQRINYGYIKKSVDVFGLESFEFQNVVEYGVGGGLNLSAIHKHVDGYYYGVDCSKAVLAECRAVAEKARFDRFAPVLVNAARPKSCMGAFKFSPVNLFLCIAVMHHLPREDYGKQVIEIASETLDKGGIAIFQIKFRDGHPELGTHQGNYMKYAKNFCTFRISDFWQACFERGLDVQHFELCKEDRFFAYFYAVRV